MESVIKNKILIVDDNPGNLQILGNLLHNLNYSCEFALSGIEALNWLQTTNFDLVLLDLVMPDMDGYEVCQTIKNDLKTCHIPIIFITIKNDEFSIVKGFKAGAADYINKPFNNLELSARIKHQIELKNANDKLSRNNHELEQKNKYIIDSIECASLIQKNTLPKPDFIRSVFQDDFLIYFPKDIISGDFYWLQKTADKIFFGVFDCTGHGVPGALVSIIGISALKEAVSLNIVTPNGIMDYLNTYFYKTFYSENNIITYEGMDLSLCIVNLDTNILEYVGVNQSITICKKKQYVSFVGDFAELGVNEYFLKPSNIDSIKLEKGDLIYLYSDGIIHQFNSENKKKFGLKRIESLLISLTDLKMEQQKQVIIKEFETWKGNNIQIDDITIWGIKY